MPKAAGALTIAASLLVLTGAAAKAQSVEEFYRGRQVRFVIHSTPGGAYDMWVRLLGPYKIGRAHV